MSDSDPPPTLVRCGMDEAGFGPNLGPLVVAVSAWNEGLTDPHPQQRDPWTIFEPVVSQTRRADRLHIADSKAVHQASRGIAALERSAFAILDLFGVAHGTFGELVEDLCGTPFDDILPHPWYAEPLTLPREPIGGEVASLVDQWRSVCKRHDLRPRSLAVDVVAAGRFNRLLDQHDGKGVLLSRTSLTVLRRIWNPAEPINFEIVADKHGGRNRYAALLSEIADGHLIGVGTESKPCSVYRVGSADIRFQMRAESEFPVAVASIVAKYLRELAMVAFNRFWEAHCPGIRPTKGYPQDARRFREDVRAVREQLGIAELDIWRNR